MQGRLSEIGQDSLPDHEKILMGELKKTFSSLHPGVNNSFIRELCDSLIDSSFFSQEEQLLLVEVSDFSRKN